MLSGTAVTYTYAVANTGNTPLATPVLADDTPPCQTPTRGADAPGNDDAILDVGETWTYSCTASPTAPVVNTATVTATPLNPLADPVTAFPDPNPDVTATAAASVAITDPGLVLTKDVGPGPRLPRHRGHLQLHRGEHRHHRPPQRHRRRRLGHRRPVLAGRAGARRRRHQQRR